MNKVTKLGVSALCGSLAAMSAANAGELAVTGGVDMSWISLDKDTTGNPIGMGSNLTFKGSGELDNGWNVALSVAMTNADVYSNTNVVVTVPTLGDIRIDQGGTGTGIDRIDDITPNVWEEAYGWGLNSGIATVAGGSSGSTIEYTPNMLPDGLIARVAYSPDPGGTAADKARAISDSAEAGAWDFTIQATSDVTGIEGLTLTAGMAEISQYTDTAAYTGDEEETTWAITYAGGGFTVGYQWSETDLGTSTTEQEYENEGYGITFNVNDDLSIGYNHYESAQVNSAGNVTAEATSIQIAYSAGGASIRLADGDVDNAAYQTTAAYDLEGTVLSVSLAF
jgi:outer membrane protein OmpU